MAEHPEQAIGRRVRELRNALGMTQRELAQALRQRGWEIDPTGVTRLEQGTRALQVRQLYLLADVLGGPVHSLLPDSELDVDLLSREVHRAFVDAREEVVRALFRLDRLRLNLEERAGESQTIEEVVESIVDFVGARGAIELLDSRDLAAEEKARLYQSLVDRVFVRVAVVYEDDAEVQHHDETQA